MQTLSKHFSINFKGLDANNLINASKGVLVKLANSPKLTTTALLSSFLALLSTY